MPPRLDGITAHQQRLRFGLPRQGCVEDVLQVGWERFRLGIYAGVHAGQESGKYGLPQTD